MKRIGFVGVGDISRIYLKNLTEMFENVEIAAVCDIVKEKALEAQKKWSIPVVYNTMQELFADESIDIVLNITRPYEHYEVTKAALLAGKHVYTEKPLAASFEQAKELVGIAAERGLYLGGAPDTCLGSGIQTCRELIDSGMIGDVVGAAAFIICRGHETWHPDPEFYYKCGGGPMLDMGPYYITALVNLIGAVNSVSGVAKATFPHRLITSQPLNGTVIDVDVPTYITGILQFENGAVGTVFTTFDVYYKESSRLEIYGTKGTLFVPDPNGFGGPVKVLLSTDGEIRELPLMFKYRDNSRGIGICDMVNAMENKKEMRLSWKQTLHVLEIMESFEKSSVEKKQIELETHYKRPEPMSR